MLAPTSHDTTSQQFEPGKWSDVEVNKVEKNDDLPPFSESSSVLDGDLEESAGTLDSTEGDPLVRWEERQRELVVSVLNYNLLSLSDLIAQKKIDLSPRYQRRARWDARRQSTLIESFLMNVPVPSVFLNEDDYGTYSVIDGKQRLTAVREFLTGRLTLSGLKVFPELNGSTIDTLPASMRSALETRAAIQAVIILRQSDKDVKFEVFRRLNTGGVRLNPQEIRNSTWPGPFNDLILSLSEEPTFHDLLRIGNKEKSVIWREMRDAEFVLRYFTFRHNWESFTTGMQRLMDEYMTQSQALDSAELGSMRKEFVSTLANVKAAFGDHAFQRWLPNSDAWRDQVLASLYDAQMIASRGRNRCTLQEHQDNILVDVKRLFEDAEFLESVNAATNTPSLFRRRVRAFEDLLDKYAQR